MEIAGARISLAKLLGWVQGYGLKMLGAALIFVVGKWIGARLARLTEKVLEKARVDETLVRFLGRIVYYVVLVAAITAAFGHLGVNTASFLTIIGTAGLAVGLALKDSLSNFASGVMLILFRPFRTTDFVTAGGVTGTVEEIAIFHTIMRTPDNQKIIVPNSKITEDVIINITAKPERRIDMVVGVSYGDDLKKTREVIERALKADERVLAEPAPQVAVCELGDSSVNFVVRPWVKTADYWPTRFALLERIKVDLDEAGITIPFPQRDVHLFQESTGA